MILKGIFAPITTPFDHEGEIYKVKVEHNILKFNQVALSGYVVCGSTGESVLLSTAEKAELFEMVAKHAASGKVLIAGTGVESVRETVKLSNRAAEIGYQFVLVKNAHYYKNLFAKPDAQLLYFRSVADRSKLPVILYNIPQFTGIDIPAEVVAKLSEHPNIAGIKDSSGNLEKVMQMIRETQPGFQVLVGSAPTIWPALSVGAAGGILGFANAAPYACVTIWEAFRTRENEAAADWQNRIAKPAQLVTSKYGIPGLKHAMDLNGYYGGPSRAPLPMLSPAAKLEIEQAFAGLQG